jgi:hypothetical protein
VAALNKRAKWNSLKRAAREIEPSSRDSPIKTDAYVLRPGPRVALRAKSNRLPRWTSSRGLSHVNDEIRVTSASLFLRIYRLRTSNITQW